MLGNTLYMTGIGMAVAFVLLWAGMAYTELGSDRNGPLKMGFYLAALALGSWAVLTLFIAIVGWGVWQLIP